MIIDELLCYLSPPTQQESQPKWRVGHKVPINVYEGDRPVCQCHNEDDARRIVEAMNAYLKGSMPPVVD